MPHPKYGVVKNVVRVSNEVNCRIFKLRNLGEEIPFSEDLLILLSFKN